MSVEIFSFVVEEILCGEKLKCGADISKWERHDGLMAKTLWVVKSGSAAQTLLCDEGWFTQCGLHIVFMVRPEHILVNHLHLQCTIKSYKHMWWNSDKNDSFLFISNGYFF